jgi:co-chaperonin GroES (HSP10)
MKMKNDYILIEERENKKSPNGLWLPPDPNNRNAEVLAVSNEDEDIEVGDIVIKAIGQGTQIKMKGKWIEAIKKSDLFAVLK